MFLRLWTSTSTAEKEIGDRCNALSKIVQLDESQQLYWQTRWVDEIIAMYQRLVLNRRNYQMLRGISMIAGVVIPALVGLNLANTNGIIVRWITLVLSVIAGISIATSELLRPGERWQLNHTYFTPLYREGIQFATLTGSYHAYESHDSAMPKFSAAIEQLLQAYAAEYQQTALRLNQVSDDTNKGHEPKTNPPFPMPK